MLSGWPTYTLNFMPERPGPLKIILRLKDAVEFRVIEDKDSDDEASGQAKSDLQSVTEEDPDTTMVCEPTLAAQTCLSASAQSLSCCTVVPKDPPSIVHTWKKFQDKHSDMWPPLPWVQGELYHNADHSN
ncbi:uncharacterized protein EDB91DRAFT_1250903 [Suillus paluster]|uniref:uncharacterized protein n=1 Tax=Suillus paluster TaxID=48578 RepID=UPI001B87DA05|nr:uncharacterized protein EDB91DRAFT_1250903 [Suillus paluster]KAG1734389.1 hypothetical protein EDB91DRAFT_1250903 [Suillus paluster]